MCKPDNARMIFKKTKPGRMQAAATGNNSTKLR